MRATCMYTKDTSDTCTPRHIRPIVACGEQLRSLTYIHPFDILSLVFSSGQLDKFPPFHPAILSLWLPRLIF